MIYGGKKVLLFIALAFLVAASPAFAGHDHGGMGGSMDHGGGHGPSHGAVDEQAAKEGAAILDSCARQIASLDRRINRIQAETAGKPAGASLREELKKLEEKLKEANEIARSLQVF